MTSIFQLEKNLFAKPKEENIVLSEADTINDTSVISDSGAGINTNLTPQNETEVVANKNKSKFIPLRY